MKKLIFTLVLMPFALMYGQSEKAANVYPSNLEENMYYTKYDAGTGVISGITFMVLSDGDNSQDYTPPFDVSLYLIPQGSSDASEVVIVKNYPLKGIYHMGSHEFKNETVSLGKIDGLVAGTYRLGIWVNSNKAFEEKDTDNAILFKNAIIFNPATITGSPAPAENKSTTESSEELVPEESDIPEDNDSW